MLEILPGSIYLLIVLKSMGMGKIAKGEGIGRQETTGKVPGLLYHLKVGETWRNQPAEGRVASEVGSGEEYSIVHPL